MVNVNPANQLAHQIRLQFAAHLARRTAPASVPITQQAKSPPNKGRLDLMSGRISALKPNDPDSPRQAFRIFLESILLEEFGHQLMDDPAFYQMVSDVQEQMQSDAELKAAMDRAGAYLLGQ
jgi:hypothetical protein